MLRTHFQFLKALDTDTERYQLVREGRDWHGEMKTLMTDGTWHKAWTSETFPNSRGAFEAIKSAFGS